MSVGPPRWTWWSRSSTACWNSDARTMSASPNLDGAGVNAPAPLIHATSVDAPFRARGNFRTVVARGRMLPSVRPLARQRTAAGLYGRCYGASGGEQASSSLSKTTECPMPELNDQSRSHTILKQDSTLIAVLEMSQSAWLVAGLVPVIERHPLKKIEPDEATLLRLLRRWQEEATKAGHPITRITLAFEAGRDGFWLARWLRAHGIEAHVIHPTSVAVSREHRRAKTDRLDTALLKRAFLGWLRGERGHCSMAEIPTLEEEMPSVQPVSARAWFVSAPAS